MFARLPLAHCFTRSFQLHKQKQKQKHFHYAIYSWCCFVWRMQKRRVSNDERELKRKYLLGNNQSECGGNKIKWDMACQNDFPTNGCLFTSCLLTDKNAIGRFDVLECWWKRENKIQVERVLFFPLSLSLKILCTSKWMKFGTKQCRIQSWHIWQASVRSNSMRWNSMEPSYIGHNVKINKSPMFRQ